MHDGIIGDAGGKFDYTMKVTGRFRKCLERQVNNGVLIKKCENEGENILNSKNEYFTSKNVFQNAYCSAQPPPPQTVKA